jgi:hypothetical protein
MISMVFDQTAVTLTDSSIISMRSCIRNVNHVHVYGDHITDIGMRYLLLLPRLHTFIWDSRSNEDVSPNVLFDVLALQVTTPQFRRV